MVDEDQISESLLVTAVKIGDYSSAGEFLVSRGGRECVCLLFGVKILLS
jgi:hypothetical protein